METKIYGLHRHPCIVAYHGHDPVTFELLLQHLRPKVSLDNYFRKFLSKLVSLEREIAQGSLTFLPGVLYGMTPCSSQMTCMFFSATLEARVSTQVDRSTLILSCLCHTYASTATTSYPLKLLSDFSKFDPLI